MCSKFYQLDEYIHREKLFKFNALCYLKKHVAVQESIREPLLFTTVAHRLIDAPSRKRDVHRFRVAFLGTFLAKQKSTNNILNQNLHSCLIIRQFNSTTC
jgi:hypothetical protein